MGLKNSFNYFLLLFHLVLPMKAGTMKCLFRAISLVPSIVADTYWGLNTWVSTKFPERQMGPYKRGRRREKRNSTA